VAQKLGRGNQLYEAISFHCIYRRATMFCFLTLTRQLQRLKSNDEPYLKLWWLCVDVLVAYVMPVCADSAE